MRALRFLLILLLLAGAFGGGYLYRSRRGGAASGGGRKVLYWVDPMHPAYKSDKPGIAPDCGMKLEPVYADGGAPEPAAQAARKLLHYRDPEQPDYHSDKPGLNPATGNQLEPVYEAAAEAMPPGSVQVSPEKQQLIGVRFGLAEITSGSQTVRAAGKVAYDETRVSHVHTRTEGWVDQVFVDFTGKLVEKGQPMLTIYSPELLASQQELLLAAKARETMKDNPLRSAADQTETLFAAARRRLQLWALSDAQIDQVLQTGQPIRNTTIFAPSSGYVLERKVFPNQKVMPDTDLYTILDLSRVWIVADVHEQDTALVRAGQTARVTLPYGNGRSFTANVDYIQPQVDPMTRTLKVRLDADNRALLLKPDMYVEVEFRAALPAVLTVPADAVLDAGEHKTVFVDRGNGFFEPRQVETGEQNAGRIAILKGLKPGERVVISGNFLIDSESQLKAAAEGMGMGKP